MDVHLCSAVIVSIPAGLFLHLNVCVYRSFLAVCFFFSDLKDSILRADAVNSKADGLLRKGVDDYKLLSEVRLTLDQIEGVFTNPPPMAPK